VRMGFEIREDIVALMSHLAGTHGESKHSLWLGPATGHVDQATGRIVQVSSHVGVDWLRVWYDYDLSEDRGSVDYGTAQVALPRVGPLTPTRWHRTAASATRKLKMREYVGLERRRHAAERRTASCTLSPD
jgi:hypothetical protein